MKNDSQITENTFIPYPSTHSFRAPQTNRISCGTAGFLIFLSAEYFIVSVLASFSRQLFLQTPVAALHRRRFTGMIFQHLCDAMGFEKVK